MDINVKVDIPALDRIADLVAAHLAGQPVVGIPTTAKADKPKAEKPAAVKEEPKAEAKHSTADPEPMVEADGDAPAVEYKVVKQLILDLVAKKGREAATTLLGQYDAKGGGDLKDTDYAAFAAKAQALLDA